MEDFKTFVSINESAEESIRSAFGATGAVPNKVVPISVNHGGTTVHFDAHMKSMDRMGKKMSTIHLSTIRKSRMIQGADLTWNEHHFTLDGKNNLKDKGYPRNVSDEERDNFFKRHGVKHEQ